MTRRLGLSRPAGRITVRARGPGPYPLREGKGADRDLRPQLDRRRRDGDSRALALRRGFAGAHLVGVLKPGVAAALEGGTWFDDRILFDPGSRDPERRTWTLLRRLRAERFDLAILFPNSFRTACVAWLAGVPRRVGYARGGRGLLLTDRLRPPPDGRGDGSPRRS